MQKRSFSKKRDMQLSWSSFGLLEAVKDVANPGGSFALRTWPTDKMGVPRRRKFQVNHTGMSMVLSKLVNGL